MIEGIRLIDVVGVVDDRTMRVVTNERRADKKTWGIFLRFDPSVAPAGLDVFFRDGCMGHCKARPIGGSRFPRMVVDESGCVGIVCVPQGLDARFCLASLE